MIRFILTFLGMVLVYMLYHGYIKVEDVSHATNAMIYDGLAVLGITKTDEHGNIVIDKKKAEAKSKEVMAFLEKIYSNAKIADFKVSPDGKTIQVVMSKDGQGTETVVIPISSE